ncbi:MAG: endonuclease V, partial [Bacteroidota bacterium]
MENRFLQEQEKLLPLQRILPEGSLIGLESNALMVTLDIQYSEGAGYVGMDILNWGAKTSQIAVGKWPVNVEYQPGFFAFREGPILIDAIQGLHLQHGLAPSLLIIDGHGTAHPRKMGVAS